MKRWLQAVLLVGSCSLFAAGCSTSASEPAEPVSSMLRNLYFGEGTYQNYQEIFSEPSKVISQPEFDKIRAGGASSMFGEKSFEEIGQEIRAFRKDEQTAVVYWVDFKLDKAKDLHWTVIKTDQGWKIQN